MITRNLFFSMVVLTSSALALSGCVGAGGLPGGAGGAGEGGVLHAAAAAGSSCVSRRGRARLRAHRCLRTRHA